MPVDERWAFIELKQAGLPMDTMVGGVSLALRHARVADRSGFHGLVFVANETEANSLRELFERTPPPSSLNLKISSEEKVRPANDWVPMSGSAVYAPSKGCAPLHLAELQTLSDRRAAEGRLFAQLRKSIALDGLIAYFLMRPLARVFTKLVLNTRVSPNQATLFALFLGLSAAVFAALGTAESVALAGILYWLGGVVDCIDGELARIRLQSSKFGEWLDSMVDEASTLSLILGLAIGLHRGGAAQEWLWVTLAGMAIGVFALGSMYRQLHREGLPIDTAQFPWFFGTATSHEGGPTTAFGYIANGFGYLIRRDANLTLTATMLILYMRKFCLLVLLAGFALTAALLVVHRIVVALRRPST